MRIDGGEPIDVSPGVPGWIARQSAARGRWLGFGRGYLPIAHHLEMIAAQRLINAGGRVVDVAVNRGPCGYFGKPTDRDKGCHQFIAAFLPRGMTLRLYGTLGSDRILMATYEGEADE